MNAYAHESTSSRESKLAVAKIARFEIEIPQVDNETAIYQTINGHGMRTSLPWASSRTPPVAESWASLIEKVDGQRGCIEDLDACQDITKRLHALGIDLNRHTTFSYRPRVRF
jgi:hypothetical protein